MFKSDHWFWYKCSYYYWIIEIRGFIATPKIWQKYIKCNKIDIKIFSLLFSCINCNYLLQKLHGSVTSKNLSTLLLCHFVYEIMWRKLIQTTFLICFFPNYPDWVFIFKTKISNNKVVTCIQADCKVMYTSTHKKTDIHEL